MAVYSYIVVRDYGFAPNPFHGYCTLATCKHVIRRVARLGDWIIGTGSVKQHRAGRLIYAMRVTERLSFHEYWEDPRFALKRPDLTGSRMRWYGDNIYHQVNDTWAQEDSHHSFPGGEGFGGSDGVVATAELREQYPGRRRTGGSKWHTFATAGANSPTA